MICSYCDAGRHARCTRDECSCVTCEERFAPPVKLIPASERVQKLVKEVKEPKEPPRKRAEPPPKKPWKGRTRKYAIEDVIRAAHMKVEGRTWDQIAAELNVGREGIRYAVAHYDYPRPEVPVEPSVNLDVEEARALAKHSILVLEEAVATAQTTIQSLQSLVGALSDS